MGSGLPFVMSCCFACVRFYKQLRRCQLPVPLVRPPRACIHPFQAPEPQKAAKVEETMLIFVLLFFSLQISSLAVDST